MSHRTGTTPFAEVDRILDELRAGRIVIIVDDEERENEGDLVCAAEFVTAESVNFMARHGRGLICMPMTGERLDALGIPLMVEQNTARRGTAFCVSIEARRDITTGISAADRAKTIRIAVDAESKPEDLASPGHVFPLRAAPGGVLRRAGHTEASVDLCRMAGLTPAAVICEVMNEDGTMARRDQLELFAREHGLSMLSIAQLIRHRMANERLVRRVGTSEIETAMGRCTVHAFTSDLEHVVHLAVVKGELDPDSPVLVRVHPADPLGDLFSAREGSALDAAMARIAEEGAGMVLYLMHGKSSWDRLMAGGEAPTGVECDESPVRHEGVLDHRDHGVGAQILYDLGVRRLRLLTNSDVKYVALDGYGLELVERVPLES